MTVHTKQGLCCQGHGRLCRVASRPPGRKDGVQLPERVVGFRGDYYELEDHAKHKVRNLIYPCRTRIPFLGVHFTRMTNGDIECGPNAVFTFKREGYGKTDFNLRDTAEAPGYGGTRKLFFKNMSFGINEYRRAFSKRLFLKTLQRLVPRPRWTTCASAAAVCAPCCCAQRRHQGRLHHLARPQRPRVERPFGHGLPGHR